MRFPSKIAGLLCGVFVAVLLASVNASALPTPSITNVIPNHGCSGELISIHGTGFNNPIQIQLGVTSNYLPNSKIFGPTSFSTTLLSFQVPSDLTPGPYFLRLRNVTDSSSNYPKSVNVTFTIDSCGGGGGGGSISDSDGDGVPDGTDVCPGTPSGTPVDSNGCSLPTSSDFDGDGVPDGMDVCPGTPPGTPVDSSGCPLSSGGCPPGFAGAPPNCYKKGDVNLSGAVDRADVRLVGGYVRGRVTLTDTQRMAADVAAPCGTVDRTDAQIIRKMVRGQATPSCTSAVAAQVLGLNSVRVNAGAQGLQFALSGAGIQAAQVQVQVLNLSGEVMFDSGMASPNALRWNLLDNHGVRVANGVYFYVVRMRDSNGQLITQVHKLAVLR